jgi:hypothetical protein
MSTTQITLGYPSGTNLFTETAIGNTALAVKASSTTVYCFDIDNSANGSASYLKVYNVASGSVTVGTTAPDTIFYVPASTRLNIIITAGQVYGTACSICCVTAGGTAGSTAPSSAVIARIVYQ